jgi:endogenous inhibitor of DNA gyrase (YacG/DUF329 family)
VEVTMYVTPIDPPPRANGTCAQCGKARPEIAESYLDPFCSTTCCRKWHKTDEKKAA